MLANYITILRGILAIVLIFYGKLDVCFWVMYCICGISDVIDGYVARKTSTRF